MDTTIRFRVEGMKGSKRKGTPSYYRDCVGSAAPPNDRRDSIFDIMSVPEVQFSENCVNTVMTWIL